MSAESDITTAIITSSAINQVAGGRFFWDVCDARAAAPYIVAQLISEDGTTPHDGQRDTAYASIQFAAWATTPEAAANVAEVLRAQLEGVTLPGTSKCALTFSGRNSNYDPATRLFGIILDMRANYQIP